MTRLEDRLRDTYRAVTDAVREDELPGLDGRRARTRRRRSRFSTFAPLAAAAAVVVAIVASVVVPKWVSSPSQPATPATPTPSAIPAGTPPFVVIMNKPDGRGYHGPLVVVSAATGRVTGTVPEPMPDTTWYDAEPTGSGTTFVLAATPLRGGLCNPSYLYTLTLSSSGAPVSLKRWTDPVGTSKPRGVQRQRGRRHPRLRRGPMPQPGSGDRDHPRRQGEDVAGVRPAHAGSLSLSADGSMLGYAESDFGQGGRVRVLDTSSAPGSATAASKIVYTYPAAGRAPWSPSARTARRCTCLDHRL